MNITSARTSSFSLGSHGHRQAGNCSSQFNYKLPVEVVSAIFIQSMTDGDGLSVVQKIAHLHYRNPWSWERRTVIAPLHLCAICRRWRNIAERTPQLWTNLEIDLGNDSLSQRHIRLFLKLIASSGALSLRLKLTYTFPPSPATENPDVQLMIDTFLLSCRRVESLDIQLPLELLERIRWNPTDISRPALKKLDLFLLSRGCNDWDVSTGKHSLGAVWDSLNHLKLLNIRFDELDISWNTLTYLSVWGFDFQDVLNVLRYAASLEYFIAENTDIEYEHPDDHDELPDVIIHSNLRFLSMGGGFEIYGSDEDMLECIRLPLLEELILDGVYDNILAITVPESFRHSLISLKRLTLKETSMVHAKCHEIVESLRNTLSGNSRSFTWTSRSALLQLFLPIDGIRPPS